MACMHRMTGAELPRLLRPGQVTVPRERRTHLIAAVAVDDVDRLCAQLACGIDDVPEHGLAADQVQHLRLGRFHALALAGGEDHDVQGLIVHAGGILAPETQTPTHGRRGIDGCALARRAGLVRPPSRSGASSAPA
jgi:hypothetical protein